MKLRNPLVTLALAGGAFGLSMGAGLAVASAMDPQQPNHDGALVQFVEPVVRFAVEPVEPVDRSILRRYFVAPVSEHGQLLRSFRFEQRYDSGLTTGR